MWEQLPIDGALSSQDDLCYPFETKRADNFVASGGEIAGVSWWGSFWNGTASTPDAFRIQFFTDWEGRGIPDTQIFSEDVTDFDQTWTGASWEYCAILSSHFVTVPGETYWVSIQAVHCFPPQWGILEGDGDGVGSVMWSPFFGYDEWTPNEVVDGYTADLAFALLTEPVEFPQPSFVDVSDPPLDDVGNSGGVAWGDYDNDGDADLYLSNRGTANRLFRNDGGGTWVDATSEPLGDVANGNGVAWADYDNDGDLDLYLANNGSANRLFRNDGGGAFVDVTSTPLDDSAGGFGVAWVDYDNDGDVDLYLGNDGSANKLFRNDGGTWVDATSVPLDSPERCRGLAWGDYDDDGDLDLYIANRGSANQLIRNDGGGAFADITTAPLDDVGNGNGVAWGDYDNDGDLDLYLANGTGQANKLFRNEEGGAWVDATSAPLDDAGSGVGVAWGDYDNDGDLDLYLANDGSANKLLRNDGMGTFADVTDVPLDDGGNGRGVAWGDYDDDGDLDLYIANATSSNRLIRTDLPDGQNWLQVELVGTVSNRAAIGARVDVLTDDTWHTRQVSGGSGYFSQDGLVASFGLGAAMLVDSLIVSWPSGISQRGAAVAANQRVRIVEANFLPSILGVTDAAGDQGRRVRVTFARSGGDEEISWPPVIRYEIYRRRDELPRMASSQSNADPSVASTPVTWQRDPGSSRDDVAWHLAGRVPAHGASDYNLLVDTLADSTITDGMHWSVFFVRAVTADPYTFFDSSPDSGYSVDNLPPEAPTNLYFPEPTTLVWDEAPEDDFDYFTVYGSSTAEFDETAVVVGETELPTLPVSGHLFYHVTARDFAGNEGTASAIEALLGVPGTPPPTAYAIRSVHPNPFRAGTSIGFDLPQAGSVHLAVFDATGRMVREVVTGRYPEGRHMASWDGRNGTDQLVAPGMYFVRMTAGGSTAVRRVVRLR